MNGTTNQDRTLYFETLPANQLELALFLEADRMRSLDINKANLDNQRNAVQEERRLRVDNQPYGQTFETIGEQAYDNPAYKHSVIGSMEDLNAASVDDVATFFKTYYAPNNAVLSIVGDVDTKKTMALVEKYFGVDRAAAASEAAGPDASRRTRRSGAARSRIRWRGCPRSTSPTSSRPRTAPTATPLDVLSDVLSSGRSSRFNQVIVREKQLATTAFGAWQDDSAGPGCSRVSATVAPGKKADDVEAALYEEIEKVKSRSDRRLGNREGAQQRAPQPGGRRDEHAQRAIQLGEYALFYNDPNLINTQDRQDAQGDRGRRAARRREVPDQGESIGDHHHAEARGRERRPAVKRPDSRRRTRRCLFPEPGGAAAARGVSAAESLDRAGHDPEEQGAGLEGDPEGHAAEAAGGRPVERRAPDRARGSPDAARQLPDDHRRRGRLLRSAEPAGPGGIHRQR